MYVCFLCRILEGRVGWVLQNTQMNLPVMHLPRHVKHSHFSNPKDLFFTFLKKIWFNVRGIRPRPLSFRYRICNFQLINANVVVTVWLGFFLAGRAQNNHLEKCCFFRHLVIYFALSNRYFDIGPKYFTFLKVSVKFSHKNLARMHQFKGWFHAGRCPPRQPFGCIDEPVAVDEDPGMRSFCLCPSHVALWWQLPLEISVEW